MISNKPAVIVAAVVGLAAAWGGAVFGAGYRFEAPDVLDLSTVQPLLPLEQGDPIAAVPLAADIATAILAAPEVGNEAPGQVPMLDGSDKVARKQEQARIAAESTAVRRAGKTLTIDTGAAGPVKFSDHGSSSRDAADGELFLYAGRIGAASYHRVEERFLADVPGSYLMNPASGRMVFAPNGSYVVQLSPDGRWLLSMSPGDTHVLLVVMALAADGPGLALVCRSATTNGALAAFKGWYDARSLDLVLTPLVLAPGKPGQGAAALLPSEPIPVRLALDDQGWHPQTPDPKALERIGYTCRR
ncbi:MAG: hypothetical protein P4L83_01735 [Nevskia sp.]|nr:hypothetical protein [Nevskia sp.]